MSTYEGSIKFSAEVDTHGAENDLKKFGDEAEKAKSPLAGFGDAEKEASAQAEKMQHDLKVAAAGVAVFTGALIAGGAAAIGMSNDFQSAYAQVQTIMDTEQTSVEAMRGDILDLSVSSGIAATEVSAAVYQAISGSVDTAKAVKFVDDANKLSIAGFTSIENATDVLTTTLNAYKLEADDVAGVSNVLIQTQNLGKTSVDELSSSIGKVIPTAAAYNVNLSNLSTAYVELTRNGIATAESTTYINGMLNELGKSGSNVSKILQQQTGKSFGQLMQDGESLGDVLGILLDSVDGNSEGFANLWGSAEAGKAALAITGAGVEDFDKILADMNGQMEGTARTTDEAYATMTKTSAYIDNQLSTSVDNLAITIGDQLRPEWDGIKSGITDVVNGFADFVRDNPWVVSAMEGIAVGSAVLAAGLWIVSGGLDSVAAAIEATTAALMSNPFVALAAAVVAVTVALAAYGLQEEEGVVSTEALDNATKSLNDTLRDSKDELEETTGSTMAAAEVASGYINRLEELDAKATKTNAEQAEYHHILTLLADTIPEVTQYIDLENDKLLVGYDVLRKSTDEWKRNAIEQAKQQAYAKIYSDMANSIVERTRKEKELQEQEAERLRLQAAIEEEEKRLHQEYIQAIEDGAVMASTTTEQSQTLDNLNAELDKVNYNISELDASIGNANDSISSAETEINELSDAYATLEAEMTATAEPIQEQETRMGELASKYNGVATALSEAWDKARGSVRNSIDGQIKAFDDFSKTLDTMEKKTKDDTKKMIASLDSQLKFMDTYAENMKKAAEMGVDEGLLASLNDGSVESAEILAGIVAGTEKQIAEMNEKWRDVQKGKETFADALTEYDLEVKSHKDTMVNIAKRAGIEIPQDMTAGLLNGLGSFQAALDRYGSAFDRMQRNARAKMASLGLPGYATGTSYAKPGVAIVGEAGPELVVFSGGEQVINATETNRILTDAERTSARAATTPMPYTFTAGNGWGGAQSASGSHDMVITVPLYIDGREFARATADEMGEQLLYD